MRVFYQFLGRIVVIAITAVVLIAQIGCENSPTTSGAVYSGEIGSSSSMNKTSPLTSEEEQGPDITNVPESSPSTKVTLSPGDVVDIKFFYAPDLNEMQTVRPDGKITLQFVDEIDVEGKTPIEIRQELQNKYSDILEKPDVSVIVRSLYNRVVYVAGKVTTPGIVDMPGNLTALEAVMRVGGFAEFAKIDKVVLFRQEDGHRNSFVIDFRRILSGKSDQKPIFLKPHDILFVP